MSYSTIWQSANDQHLLQRLEACAAQEGAPEPPIDTVVAIKWDVCTATDIAAAYESAVLADNPDPGGDPAVITDQMLLSAVQAHMPTP